MSQNPSINQTLGPLWTADADLRRRAKANFAARVVAAADVLAPADRRLMEELYIHGRSIRQLAQLIGENPRTLARRAKAITIRIQHPVFAFVTSSRDAWTPALREVGTHVFLMGASLSLAARQLGMTYHRVRRYRDAILAMSGCAESVARSIRQRNQPVDALHSPQREVA